MRLEYHQNKTGRAVLPQYYNNLRSLTLQTLEFITCYRRFLYSPFVAFPKYKIVFLAIPRSGSTSMEYTLTPLLGNGFDFESTRYEHTFRHYMYSCTPRQVATRYADFFKFTFVRNPWTRLYSCYLTRVLNRPNRYFRHFGLDKCRSFEDFALRVCNIPDERADVHFISQDYLLSYKGTFLPEQVYRFETYTQGYQEVRQVIEQKTKVRLHDIPHYYKTESRGYLREYTPKLIDLVGDRYRADCDRFGYTYPGK